MEKANKGNEILRRISFDISKDQTNQGLNLVEILGKYENVFLSLYPDKLRITMLSLSPEAFWCDCRLNGRLMIWIFNDRLNF